MIWSEPKEGYTDAYYEDMGSGNNVPVVKYEPYRHPLLKEKECDYIEDIQKELDIDQKLGLENQGDIDSKQAFKEDVDSLTKSNDYYEISKTQLEELFQIPSLKVSTAFYNIKELLTEIWQQKWVGFTFLLVATFFTLAAFGSPKPSNNCLGVLCVSCGITAFFTGIVGVVLIFVDNDFSFDFMKVYLKMESISNTQIKIPYGAKLKTLEAQDSKIFEAFIIASPDFKVEHKEFSLKKTLDPAILGVTTDQRMFMVCYWDIKHDIEKTKEKIERFKKFKVEHV